MQELSGSGCRAPFTPPSSSSELLSQPLRVSQSHPGLAVLEVTAPFEGDFGATELPGGFTPCVVSACFKYL